MKTLNHILPILLLFIGFQSFTQTPEQQKMIDKSLKMRDSIIESLNLEDVQK